MSMIANEGEQIIDSKGVVVAHWAVTVKIAGDTLIFHGFERFRFGPFGLFSESLAFKPPTKHFLTRAFWHGAFQVWLWTGEGNFDDLFSDNEMFLPVRRPISGPFADMSDSDKVGQSDGAFQHTAQLFDNPGNLVSRSGSEPETY